MEAKMNTNESFEDEDFSNEDDSSLGMEIDAQEDPSHLIVQGPAVNAQTQDILVGRGQGFFMHPGNVRFRQMIVKHHLDHRNAFKPDKTLLVKQVMSELEEQGVRFLAKVKGQWAEVTKRIAYRKVSQAFRDAANWSAEQELNAEQVYSIPASLGRVNGLSVMDSTTNQDQEATQTNNLSVDVSTDEARPNALSKAEAKTPALENSKAAGTTEIRTNITPETKTVTVTPASSSPVDYMDTSGTSEDPSSTVVRTEDATTEAATLVLAKLSTTKMTLSPVKSPKKPNKATHGTRRSSRDTAARTKKYLESYTEDDAEYSEFLGKRPRGRPKKPNRESASPFPKVKKVTGLLNTDKYPITDDDVLLGRGHLFKVHPGNLKAKEMAREHFNEYQNPGKRKSGCGVKTMICKLVVKTLKEDGARFLIQQGDGWKVASDEACYEKIKRCMAEIQDEGRSVGKGVKPKDIDVLLGRGKVTKYHPGNMKLVEYVAEYFERYEASRRHQKPTFANRVIQRLLDDGTRFLKQEDEEDEESWIQVTPEVRYEKVCQTFRDYKRSLKDRATFRSSIAIKTKKAKRSSKGARKDDVDKPIDTSLVDGLPLLHNSTNKDEEVLETEQPSEIAPPAPQIKAHLEADAVDALRSLMQN